MDTRLKNRHKMAVVLIVATIVLLAYYITSYYGIYNQMMKENQEETEKQMLLSEDFLGQFLQASWILYEREDEDRPNGDGLRGGSFLPAEIQNEYETFYPYLEYVMKDRKGEVLATSLGNSSGDFGHYRITTYAVGLTLVYDQNGEADVEIATREHKSELERGFREVLNRLENGSYRGYTKEDLYYAMPEDCSFTFAMSEENLQTYLSEIFYMDSDQLPKAAVSHILILTAVAALAACLYPLIRSFGTGEEKVFFAPLEAVAAGTAVVAIGVWVNAGRMIWQSEGRTGILDLAVWVLYAGATYWCAGNVRNLVRFRSKAYVREHSLFFAPESRVRAGIQKARQTTGDSIRKAYQSVSDLKLSDISNRQVLEVVGVNFVILTVICCTWYYGIILLVLYSILLFYFLEKYLNEIREKYDRMLDSVNAIADGSLKTEIPEETGVFAPVAEGLEKIRQGFDKAVEEEVKSQKMKTELITNVSHDLKTPLTAIITYVDLLKKEEDPEKQKEYVQVLESKSQRLKVLIEDLFEVSKASTDNVKLELMDVDIVNLLKQVKLELEDKIKDADLEFKCTFPEEKLIVRLDSQKTYRIFENLLMNIVKYALPHTRVYVEIEKQEKAAVIRMKNVSAQELNFHGQDITDRFVRGDMSRNTEGSGLGLAIVKSFTELQGGEFLIDTDGDLFKAEVRFPDPC